MKPPAHVLLSRTDSIGDVVLTLPMAKALKDAFPGVRVSFLGKAYTQPVIEACRYVDHFVDEAVFKAQQERDVDAIIHVFPKPELARQAKRLRIPLRIGTTNRLYHWASCNRLVRLSRKNSDLHEAQLNMKLLAPLGIETDYSLDMLGSMTGLQPVAALPAWASDVFETGKKVVILHPKSQGSAREWSLTNFTSLAELLLEAGYAVAVSGTERERESVELLLQALAGQVTDLTGSLSLPEFISFISRAAGLVAASTGPLHLAGALGTAAVGIYPAQRPMHAGRWGVLGPRSVSLTAPGGVANQTDVLNGVAPETVYKALVQQLADGGALFAPH